MKEEDFIKWMKSELLDHLETEEEKKQLAEGLEYSYLQIKDNERMKDDIVVGLLFPFIMRTHHRLNNKSEFDYKNMYEYFINVNRRILDQYHEIAAIHGIDAEAEFTSLLSDEYLAKYHNQQPY